MKDETWLKLALSKTRDDLKQFIAFSCGTMATNGYSLHYTDKFMPAISSNISSLAKDLLKNYENLSDIQLILDKRSLNWYRVLKNFDKLSAVNLTIKNGIITIERSARGTNKNIYGYDASIDLKVEIGSCDNLDLEYSRIFSLSRLANAIKPSTTNKINIRISDKITPLYLAYDNKIAILTDSKY